MSGAANFPTALDDDTSLIDVIDGVTTITAAQHNNLKEAIKALETRVGILASAGPTSLDYRIGNPTGGHVHNGASGQGPMIVPSTAIFMQTIAGTGGPIPSGLNMGQPLQMGRTLILESYMGILRIPPSGATTAIDIRFGPTSLMAASTELKPALAPGATSFHQPSPNLITYPSGAVISVDFGPVGSSYAGRDLSITFVFRENP